MNETTTVDDINKRVSEKQNAMLGGIVNQMLAQATSQIPKCDNCGGLLVSGAINYNNRKGVAMIVCMRCVGNALAAYIKE